MNQYSKRIDQPDFEQMQSAGRKLKVNGIDLDVLVTGKGPDVMLVHGFPDDRAVWRKQIPALVAAGYRVIAPDTRGCGESDAPVGQRSYRMQELTADLAGVLDALKIDKVKLVGHDWGALQGWGFCMRYPDRVERFVAMSNGHPLAYATAPWRQRVKGYYVFLFQIPFVMEFLLSRFNWSLFRQMTRHRESKYWIRRLSRPGRLTAALNYYRANIRMLGQRDYPPVRMPVLGIFSMRDQALVERQMLDTGKIVQGEWQYERLDGVGHWMPIDAPQQVNALLLDFLGRE